jgi:SAM-dependent MidA family methyltransferase
LQIDYRAEIVELIRERGPLTVAAFMDLALYHPAFGYYAREARRSGRAGDFFTSVDVGALFGELLEVQLAEMAELVDIARRKDPGEESSIDVVEAGAGNGRLAADILLAARRRHPSFYNRLRLHLVEASPAARAAQRATLGDAADRICTSSGALPSSFEGVLIANELLDALPVHQVVMREDGLREVYVESKRAEVETRRESPKCLLVTREGPPSTPRVAEYLGRLNVSLEPGWRVEINLRAIDWIQDAARRLTRGFIVLIDYGHDARDLYSVSHSSGTLTSMAGHMMEGAESTASDVHWLRHPGEQDLTAHVDFTSVRAAAEQEGLVTLGFLDQTYFLMGILNPENPENLKNLENPENPENLENLKRALALKTLLMPGGLGSTMKVLILGKDVGRPALCGCSYRMRVT